MKKNLLKFTALLMLIVSVLNLSGCGTLLSASAADLMEGVNSSSVEGKTADDAFVAAAARFYVDLFKKTQTQDAEFPEGSELADKAPMDVNSLISPLSVLIALTMTANGAVGETLDEMQKLLGGDISLEDLNRYLYSYAASLPSGSNAKFTNNNSIWFRDNENHLKVEPDFLQTNADYFKAGAYKAPFDASTVDDINNWVKKNTDGMIDKIIDEIEEDTVLYLLNAIVFDAKWETEYIANDVRETEFTSSKGEKQTVEMMYSYENVYIEDESARGFIKNYKDGAYSFAALMPNEGISLESYIQNMTGDKLLETLKNAQNTFLAAGLPKFSYDYGVLMNEMLKSLGMPNAFNSKNADFSKMATSSWGNIYIGEVLHKTFIQVDELGTKAGAVTKVEMKNESAMESERVILDRPFVYMIIDNATNLPIFMGTFVTSPYA